MVSSESSGRLVQVINGVVIAIASAVILGVVSLIANSVSNGGLIRILGGATRAGVKPIGTLVQEIRVLKQFVVPSGTIVFFEATKCPDLWNEYSAARGRYFVGLVPGGSPGKSVGIALSDSENRPTGAHTHSYTYSHVVRSPEAGGPGVYVSTVVEQSGVTGGVSGGAVEGTNAPYVEVLACEKK